MTNGRRDAERRTGERRRHLGDKFLLRVAARSEPALLVAVQTAAVTGPMTKLMQRRPIPVDRLMKRSLRRHSHKVMARAVKGFTAANLEARAGRGDQRIGRAARTHRIGTAHRREIALWHTHATIGRASIKGRGC